MAKKGGVQQLQTEINTFEELTKFLDRDGLIVLDVYTGWCGPCVAMIGSLKKIKLEQGGDDLHLAVVKCDHIDVFERFRNKSEPTWLLASRGKLVNSAFGSNVPHLIDLIIKELDIERRIRDLDPEASGRVFYELDEMTPVERERFETAEKTRKENERIEFESCQRQRTEYLTHVTDEIMKNADDLGVTILMPHVVTRDLLKRLSDPADKCHLVAKDKRTLQIMDEHIHVIEFGSSNPMPKYLLENILNRDVLAVCWKVADNNNIENRNETEEYLNNFVKFVWNEDEISNNSGVNGTSLLKSLSLVIETENEDETSLDEENNTKNENDSRNNGKCLDRLVNDESQEIESKEEMPIDGEQRDDFGPKEGNKSSKMEENEIRVDEPIEKNMVDKKNVKKVKIPPIWTPQDRRTNAALIYLYFRNLTEQYLPPDPPVEKPHLAIAFDAYKWRDIMEIIDMYQDDILAYGYFTTDNHETAQLLANSTFNYHKNMPTIHDKLILKVAKTSGSPVIAALKKLSPCYVSKNTAIGKAECLGLFPIGYKNSSETGEPTPEPIDEKPKKRKRKRKVKQDSEDNDTKVMSAPQEMDLEPEAVSEQGDEDDEEDEGSITVST